MYAQDKQDTCARRLNLRYVAFLSLACIMGWLGLCSGLIFQGRAPLWTNDGASLYLNFFIWEGNALRESFQGLLSGDGFSFPLYTFEMGYGADTLSALSNTLKDPLNLLSVFCPSNYALYLYIILVVVRVILSATTFSYYCLKRGNAYRASFIAALCYAFCGYIVFWGVLRHPFFINAAILFPLILAGADEVFKQKISPVFIISLGLQFFVSMYFAYMICMALFVYCIIKYFFAPQNRTVKGFISLVALFVLQIVVALLLSALASVPSVMSLLSINRVTDSDRVLQLFYAFAYYASLPSSFIGGAVHVRSIFFGSVGAVCLTVFLLCPTKFSASVRRPWVIGFILVFIGALIPYCGHIMNGFGYATDRWMFIASFCMAYIVCLTMPTLQKLQIAEIRKMIFVLMVLGLLALGAAVLYPTSALLNVLFFVCVVVFVLIIVPKMTSKWASYTMTALVLAGVSLSANSALLASDWLDADSYGTPETISSLLNNQNAGLLEDERESAIQRASVPKQMSTMKNTALNHHVMIVDYYSSLYNQDVDNFRTGLGISDSFFNYRFSGSDSRLALDLFVGAEFFITNKNNEWRVPYSYEPTGKQLDTFRLYKTKHALPIAFATKNVIDSRYYESLNMVEKQEALLQGVVLEDIDETTLSATSASIIEPSCASVNLSYTDSMDCSSDISDGFIDVLDKNETVHLDFLSLPQSEVYLVIKNLRFDYYTPSEVAHVKEGRFPDAGLLLKDLLYEIPTRPVISAKVNGKTKSFEFGTELSKQYGGKVDWVVNLGYFSEALETCELSFSKQGRYSFDSIQIMCQPVKPLVEMADKMKAGGAESLEFGRNRASAVFADSGWGVFTIPYSTGWTATVDGHSAKIMRADVGFIAIPLEDRGKHKVVLSYCTPGLKAGAILSSLGVIIFCILVILSRKWSKIKKAAG